MKEKEYENLQSCLREMRQAAQLVEGCIRRMADILYTAQTQSESCDLEWDCEECYFYYRGECALCGRKKRKETFYEDRK